MRILYVTTIGGTMRFFRHFIKNLVAEGHTVDIAANTSISNVPDEYMELGCKVFPISCTRSPMNKGTFTAIKQLKRIVSQGNYDLVHCHTPIAAMCTRLACRKARKKGMRVFYTAHGFHFYKGAPLKNWLIYYPVEKLCARLTDVLITINQEDYTFACKKLRVGKVEYVPGVGIEVDKFANISVDRDLKRDEIGIPRDAFFMLSVGDLNHNKNHEVMIRAMAEMDDSNIHYGIAGKGSLRDYLISLAKKLGVEDRVHMLGFRADIPELYKSADLCAFPSIREGLPVSVMEAMASGLPIICSRIRGNTDLMDEKGGFLFDPSSVPECTEAIKRIRNVDLESMGRHNYDLAKCFEVKLINERMREIYGL